MGVVIPFLGGSRWEYVGAVYQVELEDTSRIPSGDVVWSLPQHTVKTLYACLNFVCLFRSSLESLFPENEKRVQPCSRTSHAHLVWSMSLQINVCIPCINTYTIYYKHRTVSSHQPAQIKSTYNQYTQYTKLIWKIKRINYNTSLKIP